MAQNRSLRPMLAFGIVFAVVLSGLPLLSDHADGQGSSSIYVDASNTSGIEDGTAAHPYDTIQEGIDYALPGETVLVRPGQYPENLILNKDLTLNGLVDDSGARPRICPPSGTALLVSDGINFEVSGFVFSDCEVGIRGTAYGMYVSNGRATIHSNVFTNIRRVDGGFWCYDTQCGGEAIYIGGLLNIYNNIFFNNSGGCGTVVLRSDGGTHYFYNNTMSDNTNDNPNGSGCASLWMAGPRMYVFNNIIVNETTGAGVHLYDPYGGWTAQAQIEYNLMFNNYGGNSTGVPISRTIGADPGFIDPDNGDYRPQPNSPCIDAGTNEEAPSSDFQRYPRPVDGDGDETAITDMGAHEYVPPDVYLEPLLQAGCDLPGTTVPYTLKVNNRTGNDDSFDLTVSGNAWPTSLSMANTGIILHSESVTLTVEVQVPDSALPGDTDTVTINATSLTDPAMADTATVTTTAISEPLEEGLIAYFPFNGNAYDESGNNHHGTISGATLAADRFGNSNSAYSFDGSNDYVEIPDDASFDFGAGGFTVSAWIKTDATTTVGSGRDEILSKGDATISGFALSVRNNKAAFWIGGSGEFYGSSVVNDGEWHQIVGVRDDSGNVVLCVDGITECTGINNENVDTDYSVFVGKHGTSNESYFDGLIDDVRIYNRAVAPPGVFLFEPLLDQIEAEVSDLRGLSPLEESDYQFITRDEWREWLVEDLEEDIEEINITQELFVLLDLMEEGQDLYTILLEYHSEGILGFYDDELETFCIISDVEELGPSQKVTFAHEYAHFLQDQHFDLESLPSPEDNSDLSLAVRSLAEGDATLVEGFYIFEILDETEREAFFQESEESENGAFEAAPRVIQENRRFPYVSGMDFVHALGKDGGWQAINEAYGDPPRSTEQILHPEKYYLKRDRPQSVTLPDLESALGAGWSQLDSDVLGELNIRIYLETFLGIDSEEAATAAEGWDGDRYVFLKDAEGRRLLVLSSVWDSETDAEEFFDAYITFVQEKSGGAWTLRLDDVGEKWWKTEGLSLYLGQEASEALLVIAPDEATAEVVLAEFSQFYAGLTIETVIPDTECTVEALDGMVIIQLPVGAVSSETEIVIRGHPSSDAPSAPSGFKLGDTCFSIEGITVLAKEVTITVTYSDKDVAAAGGDPNLLSLARYDEDTRKWVFLPTMVDTTIRTLTVTTNELSLWALLAEEPPSLWSQLKRWLWLMVVGGIAVAGVIVLCGRSLYLTLEWKKWEREGFDLSDWK